MAQAQVVKDVVAWPLANTMKAKISKRRMAQLLETSPTQVDRLRDATDDNTLASQHREAAFVGRNAMTESL